MNCPNPNYPLVKTLHLLMLKMAFQKTSEIKQNGENQFEPEKEAITSVVDTDESEEECSEKSDEECHSHSAIKERVANTTWCKCFKCNVEKREIDCLSCLEVTALNEKFDKLLVKCVTEGEEFQVLLYQQSSA